MARKRGFTLIELLVVIAIIALLLAILMPALARVKKQARAVACQGLLRQWGAIWSMFCDDNNGYFSNGQAVWTRGQWVVELRSQYQTKTDILNCPSATKRLPSGDVWGGPYNTYAMPVNPTDNPYTEGGEEPSYGVNTWIYNQPQSTAAGNYWKTKDSKGAAKIPVFADTMWRGGGPTAEGTAGDPPQSNGQWIDVTHEMMHFCIDRHEGTINMLFMDWHVEKVGLKGLWKLKWHKNFNTNGKWAQPNAPWPVWMNHLSES